MSDRTPRGRTAILLAAVALVLGGCGGGSADQGSSSTADISNPEVETAPQASANAATGGRKTRQGGDQESSPDRQKAGADSKKKQAPAGEKPEGRDSKKQHQKAEPAKTEAHGECPAGVTAAECKQVAEAVSGGQQSGVTADDCPAGLTAAQCREAMAAVEAEAGAGGSGSASDCPAGVSASECREVAESLR